MRTATGLRMAHHGLIQRERADLWDWLGHIKLSLQRAITDHKKSKKIELILFDKEAVKNRLKQVDTAPRQASILPLVYEERKPEIRSGNTVYLRHKDTIRAIILADARSADPANGRISVMSPIGRTLAGRHEGNRVSLATLDGELDYEIIKIV